MTIRNMKRGWERVSRKAFLILLAFAVATTMNTSFAFAEAGTADTALMAAEANGVDAASGADGSHAALEYNESGAYGHDYVYWGRGGYHGEYLHVNNGKLELVDAGSFGLSIASVTVSEIAPDFKSYAWRKTLDPKDYFPSDCPSGAECLWGGFFSGATHNCIVTGQAPDYQNRSVAYRITKYTKDWVKDGYCEFAGPSTNTSTPFSGGSCSMVESDGKLYVRTCRVMSGAESVNGGSAGHQAAFEIVLDESNMEWLYADFYPSRSSTTMQGYVSHSFNQLQTVLDGRVYYLDHGDGSPRAVVAHRCGNWKEQDGFLYNVTKARNIIESPPFDPSIEGNENITGASIGGYESSATTTKVPAVGNWAYDESARTGAARDVWTTATTQDLETTSFRRLTSYSATSTESAGTPFLVKVNENKFLVMWGVKTWALGISTGGVRYQYVDGNGDSLTPTKSIRAGLSECQPILYQGKIAWCVYEGGAPVWYFLDPETGEFSFVETLYPRASCRARIRSCSIA